MADALTSVPANPRIFLSAGEASGDLYGALLITALRAHLPNAVFFGLGGAEMETAGQRRVVRAEEVAHMGITEVLRHIPRVFAEYRKLIASIRRERPDVAVLIDFPDVNLRLARELKALKIPVIYFVSPQLWAWKKRRIRWVRQRVAKMMVIFPFEAPFYRARGVDAEFVGHPLAELPLPPTAREEYAAQHRLDPAKQWIALLPGSRMREAKANLPTMLEAAQLLHSSTTQDRPAPYEFLLPVASTLRRESLSALLQNFEISEKSRGRAYPHIHLVDDARSALHHARVSVVASGTATVQAALIGNPFLVVYRVSPLTYWLARRLISYPPEIHADRDEHGHLPVAMVNLIAGKRIVPELLQSQFTTANLVARLRPLLDDEPLRATMRSALAAVRDALRPHGSAPGTAIPAFHAIERVCSEVLRQLPPRRHS